MSIKNRLVFTELGHKYFRVNSPEKLWKSVTTVVKDYSEPFKREEWLVYKAFEKVIGNDEFKAIKAEVNSLYNGFNFYEVIDRCYRLIDVDAFLSAKKEIEQEWCDEGVKSAAKGTAGHLELELASFSRGTELNLLNDITYQVPKRPTFEYDNEQISENLIDLEDGYYPELMVWYEIDENRRTCGQADGIFIRTVGSRRLVTVRDYKFVKGAKMNTQNYCSVARQGVMMKPPIAHIPCSKIHGYQLQLSIYGNMLERAGFEVEGMWIDHFNEKSKKKIIPLEYLQEESHAVLDDFLSLKK